MLKTIVIFLLTVAPLHTADLPQAEWEWHGPIEKVIRAEFWAYDSTRVGLVQGNSVVVYDRSNGAVVMSYADGAGITRRDRKHIFIRSNDTLYTCDLLDGKVTDMMLMLNEYYSVVAETDDGNYVALRSQNYLAIYRISDGIVVKGIDLPPGVTGLFFDDLDNSFIVSCAYGFDGPNPQPSGSIVRYYGTNWTQSQTVVAGKPCSPKYLRSGYLLMDGEIIQISDPRVKPVVNVALGRIMTSGRVVTIRVADKYLLSVYDSSWKVLLFEVPITDIATSYQFFERADSAIVVCMSGSQLVIDVESGRVDTNASDLWPSGKAKYQVLNNTHMAITDDLEGIRFYNGITGRFEQWFRTAGFPIELVRSSKHGYTIKSGYEFSRVDSATGIVLDRKTFYPPVASSIYSPFADRWYWIEDLTCLKGVKSFDTNDVAKYYEHGTQGTDYCLSFAGDTVWTLDVQGSVLQRNMKSGNVTRRVVTAKNNVQQEYYRLVTRNHDSTLVLLCWRRDSMWLEKRSLIDTAEVSTTELGTGTIARLTPSVRPWLLLTGSDEGGYVAVAHPEIPFLSIYYDNGNSLSIPVPGPVISLIAINNHSQFLACTSNKLFLVIDANSGQTLNQVELIGNGVDMDFVPQSNTVYIVLPWYNYGGIVTSINLSTMLVINGEIQGRQCRLMHNGNDIALIGNHELMNSMNVYSLITGEIKSEQFFADKFTSNQFQVVGSGMFPFRRSADGSTLAVHGYLLQLVVAWMKSTESEVEYPWNGLNEVTGVVRVLTGGEWIALDGKRNRHVYDAELNAKWSMLSPQENYSTMIAPGGGYSLLTQTDRKGTPNVLVSLFNPPLNHGSSEETRFQPETIKDLSEPTYKNIPLRHPQIFGVVDANYEFRIRNILPDNASISTGVKVSLNVICEMSPNAATLAIVSNDSLSLFDMRTLQVVRRYKFDYPIHSFTWDDDNEHAYIAHSHATFGRYSFSGIVSVHKDVSTTSNCDLPITLIPEGRAVRIKFDPEVESHDTYVMMYSSDGESLIPRTALSTSEAVLSLPNLATQVIYVIVTNDWCQRVFSFPYTSN